MALPAVPALVRGAALLPLLGRETAMSAWRHFAEGLGYTPHEVDLMDMARNGEEVAVTGRDYLAEALAAEEHRQGAVYGDDADHCGDCATEALRRRQAACEHEEASAIEVTRLCDARRELLRTCRECGLSWREEGEWL